MSLGAPAAGVVQPAPRVSPRLPGYHPPAEELPRSPLMWPHLKAAVHQMQFLASVN